MFKARHRIVRLKAANGRHIRRTSCVELLREDGSVFCAVTLLEPMGKREAIRQAVEMCRRDNTIGPLTRVV